MVPAHLSASPLALNPENVVTPPQLLASFVHQPGHPVILVSTQVKDTDLFANVQQSFNHFLQSGQAWSLVIGLVVGYLFRGITR